jgi:hypothetical protein
MVMVVNILRVILVTLILVANVAGNQSASGQRPQTAPDHSLAPAIYIQKGLPANDRNWDAQDYLQAAKVLQSLAGADTTQLPRYGSLMSGAVFARIVSHDNFMLFENAVLNKQQRFKAATAIMEGLGQITVVYASATTQERIFDSELIELMRYLLELSAKVTQLADAFIASLPANDPDHDARVRGHEQMQQGMARVVIGCLDSLAERASYQSSDLLRLSETLDSTVQVIFPFLLPGSQQELSLRIQQMIEKEPNSSIKERLLHLAAALTKSKTG